MLLETRQNVIRILAQNTATGCSCEKKIYSYKLTALHIVNIIYTIHIVMMLQAKAALSSLEILKSVNKLYCISIATMEHLLHGLMDLCSKDQPILIKFYCFKGGCTFFSEVIRISETAGS